MKDDYIYGCCGGPKNNGRFMGFNSLGQTVMGVNNRPVRRFEWERLHYAGARKTVERKWYNLFDRTHPLQVHPDAAYFYTKETS